MHTYWETEAARAAARRACTETPTGSPALDAALQRITEDFGTIDLRVALIVASERFAALAVTLRAEQRHEFADLLTRYSTEAKAALDNDTSWARLRKVA